MFAGRAPSWNGGFLNYHLERREEVIKINLGRRSPEKSGGEVELMIVRSIACRQCTRLLPEHLHFVLRGEGLQLQILSPGVTEAVWQWLRREAGGSERVGHIDSQGETFFKPRRK